MESLTHEALWNKILQFQIDDPLASFTFSDKLAKENQWSKPFTERAVLEYKKFILLCCISPTGASPSPIVDEVWHLHLTYTQNYWKEFCANVLQKEIHHHPSKGGHSEKNRHQNWYEETLALYREVFGEPPPVDIWPSSEMPKATVPLLNEQPRLSYFTLYKRNFYLLLLPFIFPFFFGRFHPFALTGPQFLYFYGFLLMAVIIFFVRVRRQKREMIAEAVHSSALENANAYAVARFVYGRNKVIETAIVDLVTKEMLTVESRDRFRFHPQRIDPPTIATNPLASNLFQLHKKDSLLSIKELHSFYNDDLSYHDGLATLYQRVVIKDYHPSLIGSAVMILGIMRMQQGITNGYPVTYLQYMLMAGCFVLLIFVFNLSASSLLKETFLKKYNTNELTVSSDPLLPKFVFLGLGALTGTYAFANLETVFRHHRSDDSFSGSSCGSSGCGSSCGSSCGGGCGGCGGGD